MKLHIEDQRLAAREERSIPSDAEIMRAYNACVLDTLAAATHAVETSRGIYRDQ